MSRSKVTPWLLAASVFLSGAAGLVNDAANPAYAITSVEELRDVDSSHWAYDALADLVEKYDVIEGYPDHTFRGDKAPNRWEMAAALNSLIKAVGRDLARLGAEKANKSDLATLARLQEEFRNELAALNARTAALESRASAIEAKNSEQDSRLDLLERTQLHGDVSLGFLADFSDDGTGTSEMLDGISTLGRLRLGIQVPVVEGYDDSKIGEGDIVARVVGAFGRWAPLGDGDGSSASTGGSGYDPISGYSAIAGGASSFNQGFRTASVGSGVSGGAGNDARPNLYVESVYYKQHYKPGIPVVSDWFIFPDEDGYEMSSDLYVGILPWRNLFNRSPYKGDELNQFQNTSLVNNAGLLVNNTTATVAMAWHQGLGEHWSADITGAAAVLDHGDALDGLSITEELSINYDTYFLGDDYTKPGNVYVGGSHIMFSGHPGVNLGSTFAAGLVNRDGEAFGLTDTQGGVNSFYAGWNQEWWRGIGTSVDYVMNETSGNNALVNSLRNGTGSNVAFNRSGLTSVIGIQQALSAVMTVPLTAFNQDLTKRAKDVIGVGYSWIDPMDRGDGEADSTFDSTNEHVIEAFYRYAVNDSVTIIPSFQAIINRFGIGENDSDFVLGLRTNYVF